MSMSITVATDLSARSDRAFDRGVQLAGQFGAKLIIVHALKPKQELSFQTQKARTIRSLERVTADLGFPIEYVIEYAPAPELVAQVALEQASRMIVLGPARHDNVSAFFLGTAADYLVQRATAPVLLVKERPLAPYDGLVVATDFSDRSRHALVTAATLFEPVPATLVHAFGNVETETLLASYEKWSSDRMTELIACPDVAPLRDRLYTCTIESGRAYAIEKASRQYRHPLAVLGAHDWGRVARAVLGRRASRLLADIPGDILIIREGIGQQITG